MPAFSSSILGFTNSTVISNTVGRPASASTTATVASTAATVASESVKVIVRCRPLSTAEIQQGHTSVVNVDVSRGIIDVSNPNEPGQSTKSFTFDAVYDGSSKQIDLYDESLRDLVDSVLHGFNGTIFAYGQTGTGKTFTMQGVRDDPELRGVIPNAIRHIFDRIALSTSSEQFLVRASYLEIYQEEIRDLLDTKDSRRRLELKERPDLGVFVKDLSSFVTKSVEEIEQVLAVGHANRSVGCTNMNEHSSRSHAIFILTVECSEPGLDGKNHIRVGRLNLVDLAGSERQTKTGTQGQRFREATKINLSLSALGNVISALVDNKSGYVPYRDSKLTRLLQDSLGGNSKTVMVANIGPASYNYDETMGTLRYASRAKNIQNKPKINEDPKDALLREFQEEINRLKALLDKRTGSVAGQRQPRSATGDLIADDSRDEGVEDLNAEEYVQEQQQKLEQEREELMRSSSILGEERQQMLNALEARGIELARELKMQAVVAAKIRAMQSKLLSGDGNFLDRTNQQQELLQKRRLELVEQKRREREIAQRLEEQEDGTAEIRETFASLQQEVEAKKRKTHKFLTKLEQVRIEIIDVAEANAREREELAAELTEIDRTLKQKCLLIENFVPSEFVEQFKSQSVYDADEEIWRVCYESGEFDEKNRQTPRNKPEMIDSGLESSGSGGGSGPGTASSFNGAAIDTVALAAVKPSARRSLCHFERQLLARLRLRVARQRDGASLSASTTISSTASDGSDQPILPSNYVPYEVARVCFENVINYDGPIPFSATVCSGPPSNDNIMKRPTSAARLLSTSTMSVASAASDTYSRIPIPRSYGAASAGRRTDDQLNSGRSRRTLSAAPSPAAPQGGGHSPQNHYSSMLNVSKNSRARSVLRTQQKQHQIIPPPRAPSVDVLAPNSIITATNRQNFGPKSPKLGINGSNVANGAIQCRGAMFPKARGLVGTQRENGPVGGRSLRPDGFGVGANANVNWR